MENIIDMSFLKDAPIFNHKIKLEIQPLTPLSMVDKLPGSYYHTLIKPSDTMIYGLLENMMFMHFSEEIRTSIIKDLKKHYKKEKKELPNFIPSGSKYNSLLQQHIKIEEIEQIGDFVIYEDLWSQHLKRSDDGHYRGARNYDWRLETQFDILKEGERTKYYPYYYVSPTNREYLIYRGTFRVTLSASIKLINLMKTSVSNVLSVLYLGSNDGWVEVVIEELK